MAAREHNPSDYNSPHFPTWCPGCGDYGIWAALKASMAAVGLAPHQTVIVFGVGCSGNMANTLKVYGFHGLHGRAIPIATGTKLANHALKVIVIAGDGDCYGEGLSHFINAARGNHDITAIVHNNHVYGLTTGQTSPTSATLFKTKSTPHGAIEIPLNPLALAIGSGATFVARGFAGDIPYLTQIFQAAISHKGFAHVDVFQPCVTFNKINTYDWYRSRLYALEKSGHNPESFMLALERAYESERLPFGVFYKHEKAAYHEQVPQLQKAPLVMQSTSTRDIAGLMKRFA